MDEAISVGEIARSNILTVRLYGLAAAVMLRPLDTRT